MPLTLLQVLPEMEVRSRLRVPLPTATLLVNTQVEPVMTMSLTVSAPPLCSTAPPNPLATLPILLPPAKVIADTVSVVLELDRTRDALLPDTVNKAAPGPVMVMLRATTSSPLLKVIVRGTPKNTGSKVMVLPTQASAMAWRSEPAPASAALATTGLVMQSVRLVSANDAVPLAPLLAVVMVYGPPMVAFAVAVALA